MQQFEKEVEEFFAKAWADFGLDSTSAKLFAAVYLEPGEISMNELSKKTGYSLATISNKLKLFEKIGLLEKRKKPGSKKIYLFTEKSIFKMQQGKINALKRTHILPAKSTIPKIVDKYKNTKMNDKEKKKLIIISNYLEQMEKLDKVTSKWSKDLEKMTK